MDISQISSAYNGLKTAKEIFTGFIDLKIETATVEKINEAVKKVAEAQDALFSMREELFRLQEENNSLKQSVSTIEEWKSKVSNYSIIKTETGAVVYKSNKEPILYICPNCINKQQIQPLQEVGEYSGDSDCPSCKSRFPIKQAKEIPEIEYENNNGFP